MTRLSELSLILVAVTSMLTSGVTGQCIKDLQTIVDMEEAATDYSQERTYTLCPRTIFEMGTLNHNYDLQGFNVDPPIPIRPNLHVKCGDDGSKENLCWIATGDLHLDGTSVRGITETSIENVVIEGIVFIGAQKYSVWANKPGDITFKNCEWRVRLCKYLCCMVSGDEKPTMRTLNLQCYSKYLNQSCLFLISSFRITQRLSLQYCWTTSMEVIQLLLLLLKNVFSL